MLNNVLAKGSAERNFLLFILKLFLIWLSWKGIIWVLGIEYIPLDQRMFPTISKHWEDFNLVLVKFILHWSNEVLLFLGYDSTTSHRTIRITGAGGVGMGNYCIGLQLIYYYTMLVIITPMKLIPKLISIPVGIIITFLLNIMRVSSLCLIAYYTPQFMAVAHDHIFNIIVFGTLMIYYYLLTKER